MNGRVTRGGRKAPPKIPKLVVSALKNLHDSQGSSAKDIMKYIMAEYNASEAKVQQQVSFCNYVTCVFVHFLFASIFCFRLF